MKTITHLPQPLRELAAKHFVLLQSQNPKNKRDTIELNLSGYADVMYLMADIVKVCMLALEGETSFSRIPEPATNISGVLGIVLDLIPYEEADLLDKIREATLNPTQEAPQEHDYILESVYLSLPTELKPTT
ncbi:hypothetical protein EZL74_07975 [Flavobacterium silvisoli]|uniref:Uncharacterized protein n=1 Tax=Flavobacterium silvisoli TaxID=2529433 RepID=A0A4Q9Z0M3_9FLAO|nr:hypothetical protein [Flavobacterium silvisoli]TBX68723.1 hypothetical protein EZL74_07975 [Flavobacterium silvisoli]